MLRISVSPPVKKKPKSTVKNYVSQNAKMTALSAVKVRKVSP
jgi:hypothetical protein